MSVLAAVSLTAASPSPSASAASDHFDVVTAPRLFYSTVGSDGRLWSRDDDAIRRLDVDGSIVKFPLSKSTYGQTVTATDGSVWTTADNDHEVWRVDPADPMAAPELVVDFGTAAAYTLTPAGGGRVWAWQGQVAPNQNRLVVMDSGGTIDTFDLVDSGAADTFGTLAGAPDGSLWFGTEAGGLYEHDNTIVNRVALNGASSEVTLETNASGAEDVTSMAFDSGGTLWYTTFRVGVVTVEGDRGGGIGRYAPGVSDWWARPLFPEPDRDATYDSGPRPTDMQQGPNGWMYFSEHSQGDGHHLSRVDESGKVQFVETKSLAEPRVFGPTVWLRSVNYAAGQYYAHGNLYSLFDVGGAKVRVSFRWHAAKAKFTGRVRSPNSGCERTQLRLYRVQQGKRHLVSKRRSKSDGSFKFRVPEAAAGRYFVKTKRVALPGGVTTCRADTSPRRTVTRRS